MFTTPSIEEAIIKKKSVTEIVDQIILQNSENNLEIRKH